MSYSDPFIAACICCLYTVCTSLPSLIFDDVVNEKEKKKKTYTFPTPFVSFIFYGEKKQNVVQDLEESVKTFEGTHMKFGALIGAYSIQTYRLV